MVIYVFLWQKRFLKLPTVVVWDTDWVLVTLGSEEEEVAKTAVDAGQCW